MTKRAYTGFKWIAISIFSLIIIGNLSAQDSSQNNSEEYFILARAEGSRGNFAKAANYCEKGLKKSPLDMDLKEYLGKCYMELGQLEKARMTLLEVLKKSPRRVDARHYLINIETQEKRYYSAVCYANELLEITPYAKELWLKKVQLYNLMDNRVEASRTAKRLYQIFPVDKEVKSLFNNILRDDALSLTRSKDYAAAASQYERILESASTDPESYLNLINVFIKTGNYAAALSVADRGLQTLPTNMAILDKKIGLLDETHDYQKAIMVTEDRLRKGESAHYRKLLNYLTQKAARFYKNSDPYVLYGKIYDKNPGDKEAFDYLLATAISRNDYQRAEELISRGLKSNPNSKELLSRQLYVFEAQQQWEKSGNTIEKLHNLYPNDNDVKDRYHSWTYQKAKVDFNDKNYKEALWGFLKVSQSAEYERFAPQYIFAIQSNQKEYSAALKTIDQLIAKYPSDTKYKLNKIDVLLSMEAFDVAYNLAKTEWQNSPQKPEFTHMLNQAAMAYIKHLNTTEDYLNVKLVAEEWLNRDVQSLEAYNYGINARVAMKQYEEAINFIQTHPLAQLKSKDLKLKLAGVYAAAGQHLQSSTVLKELHEAYPFNDSLKNNLVEEMLLHAKSLDDSSAFAQSQTVYEAVRSIDPKNSLAAIKLTNILIASNELDRSMQIIDSALIYHDDQPDLLFQKGLIYEKKGDFKLAKVYHAKFMKPLNTEKNHRERLDYLEGKELKNQVNVSYLNATSDSTILNTSVATLEYLKDVNKNNTVVARVNYAARKTGVGLQAELDWYHTFKSKSSFVANVAVANQFFPEYKASFSYFKPIAKVWQAELGAKYAKLNDNTNFLTGVVGLERTFDKVWVNARALLMKDETNFYHSVLAQSRFYMKNEKNYLVVMASAGTAPENERLDFQFNTFTSYINTMVGAGYYHYLNARTSLGVQGNWYNFKMQQNSYLNQYNLFLTVRTRF